MGAPTDKNYESLGYESVYFFSNIGIAIFFFIFIILQSFTLCAVEQC